MCACFYKKIQKAQSKLQLNKMRSELNQHIMHSSLKGKVSAPQCFLLQLVSKWLWYETASVIRQLLKTPPPHLFNYVQCIQLPAQVWQSVGCLLNKKWALYFCPLQKPRARSECFTWPVIKLEMSFDAWPHIFSFPFSMKIFSIIFS